MLLTAASVLFAPTAAQCSIAYVVTDLGTLNNDDQFSQGFGINNYGQVAGVSLNGQAIPHVFLWTPGTVNGTDGAMRDLGVCSSGFDDGLKLNSYGQLQFNRGVSTTSFGVQSHAFLWTPAAPNGIEGSAADLLTLNGADGASYGYGINDDGAVVGFSYPGACFIWTPASPNAPAGTMTDFGNRSSGGVAFAINKAGQVAGSIQVTFFNYPIIHPGPGPYSTNDIIGPGPATDQNDQSNSGTGYAINAAGHVAGSAVFSGGVRPFIYTGGGLLNFAPDGTAYGINSSDQAVGDVNNNAFVYRNGATSNLLSLLDPAAGWAQLTSARAINDKGQIAGTGAHNGALHAFLLTPVELILRFTTIRREGADIRLIWQTTGGKTNQLQVANGNFSFADLGAPMVIGGVGATSASYLDIGGATNAVMRLYRISMPL
jgi:probable HAF family extracellular repeat protein